MLLKLCKYTEVSVAGNFMISGAFLDAFVELRKATVRFVMSICSFARNKLCLIFALVIWIKVLVRVVKIGVKTLSK